MDYQLSIWERDAVNKRYDVVIAGAGFAGLWCALEIKKRSPLLKILVVERGAFATGASGRNAGFACFGSPTEMIHDIASMGEDNMWRLVEMRYRGMEKIRNTFAAETIDLDECGGYECLAKDSKPMVADNLEWLNKGLASIIGVQACFSWRDEKLAAFGMQGFDGLVENRLEGGLHSGKLLQALQSQVIGAGVNVLFSLEITSGLTDGKVMATYNGGPVELRCERLLYCTNAFTNTITGQQLATPGRGQVIVTSPISGLRLRGTFHYDEGYYYFRNVGDRVLLGGARNIAFAEEQTTEMVTTEVIQQRLRAFLHDHLLAGCSYDIAYQWSGIMAFTPNKQSIITSPANNTMAVIGCNGMGVALLPVLAEEVATHF